MSFDNLMLTLIAIALLIACVIAGKFPPPRV